jgi:arylsulfatase A-like enzyme
MDRRLFVTGLFGVAGAAALAAIVTPQAAALAGVPAEETAAGSSVLPNLEDLKADSEESGDAVQETGEQLAWHNGYPHGRRRRRRRRHRRWRRVCRRYWYNGYYRRRCRRRPFWIWLSIG